MGNYEQLKQSVSDVIKTNGNQEITGSILQNVLLTIISTVGANATFVGVATPATNPGTPDGSVFYLASEAGTYSNFGSIELQDGLSVLIWNGSWSSQQIFSIDDVPTAGSDNLVKSGGVAKQINSISTELSALNIVIVPPSANLLDMSKAVTGHVSSSDGTLDSSMYQYETSDYFDVSNKYNWYYCANDSYCNVAFYDENKQFLYGQDNIPYSTSRKITNQNVKYARVSYPAAQQYAFFYVSQTLWTEAPVYEQYHAASVTIHCDIQGNVYGDVYGNIQGINLDGGEIDLGGGLIRLNNGKIIIGKSDATITVSDKLHHLISIGQNATSDAVSRAIAIGTNALASSTATTNSDDGHYNVAIGHNSMQSSTTGNHNTAVGWGTMIDLTTGTGNTACGEDALCHTVIGINNTAIGNRAMQTATGNNNVAIGSLAMYSDSQSVPNGSFNVAVGASSGCSDTGDGDHNTAIGHGAGCSSQYRYTTTIGAGAHATKSRQVVIGSTESGTAHPLETILNGDIIVLGTDMIARKLVYNQDGSIGWTEVTLQ